MLYFDVMLLIFFRHDTRLRLLPLLPLMLAYAAAPSHDMLYSPQLRFRAACRCRHATIADITPLMLLPAMMMLFLILLLPCRYMIALMLRYAL